MDSYQEQKVIIIISLFGKEAEMEIVCRKFTEQCPGDPHLWSSEGSRSGQRDSLNCDAGAIEVSQANPIGWFFRAGSP